MESGEHYNVEWRTLKWLEGDILMERGGHSNGERRTF